MPEKFIEESISGEIGMKIVQVNSECGRGSTGKIAVAISKLLTVQKVENYIFYSGNHTSDYPLGIRINNKLELRIHQALSRLFGDQGWHSYFTTKRLVSRIKRINPDIIHLHNIHGYYIHMGVLFKYLSSYDKQVIWTLHDCWAFTGHCTHFLLAKCEKWKTRCGNCPNRAKYPYSLLFDRSKELYEKKKKLTSSIPNLKIITPSDWLANLVSQSFLSNRTVQVIKNGINLSVFKPRGKKKYKQDGKFLIIGVSSIWHYGKGLDVFCEMAKLLNQAVYQIIVVGTDEKVDMDLPSSIISIHRTQNQNELVQLYSEADLLVNPTREDNYPTVNLEAIACGTPVLTFNTGGSVESVVCPEHMVVRTNTIQETIEKIEKIRNSRFDYSSLCAKKAEEFDERKCFSNYLDAYGLKHTGDEL